MGTHRLDNKRLARVLVLSGTVLIGDILSN